MDYEDDEEDYSNTNEKRLYVREFLNKPGFHSTGFILAEVSKTDLEKAKKMDYYSPEMTLVIGDCNKTVAISFDPYKEEDIENIIFKVTLLAETINQFRNTVLEELEIYRDYRAFIKAKKAAKEVEKKLKEEASKDGKTSEGE